MKIEPLGLGSGGWQPTANGQDMRTKMKFAAIWAFTALAVMNPAGIAGQQLFPSATVALEAYQLDWTQIATSWSDSDPQAEQYDLRIDGEPGNATLGAVFGAAVGYVIADASRGHPGIIILGALMGSILFYQVGIG